MTTAHRLSALHAPTIATPRSLVRPGGATAEVVVGHVVDPDVPILPEVPA